MTDVITLVLRSTDEARNRFRIGALRYAASILRRLDEHQAADKLIVRASRMARVVPDALEVMP